VAALDRVAAMATAALVAAAAAAGEGAALERVPGRLAPPMGAVALAPVPAKSRKKAAVTVKKHPMLKKLLQEEVWPTAPKNQRSLGS